MRHDLTLESAVFWIRELQARLSRLEREVRAVHGMCPVAAKVVEKLDKG